MSDVGASRFDDRPAQKSPAPERHAISPLNEFPASPLGVRATLIEIGHLIASAWAYVFQLRRPPQS